MADEHNQSQDQHQDKLVPEKDLLAIKAGRDSLEQKLKELESTHSATVAEHQKKVDEATSKLYAAEASVKKFEEQLKESAGATTALAEAKAKLEAAEKRLTDLTTKTLELRKRLIASTFNISPEVIKDKSLEQLDLYEEALKAVTASRGAGNYATGGSQLGGDKVVPAREKIRSGFDVLHPADR